MTSAGGRRSGASTARRDRGPTQLIIWVLNLGTLAFIGTLVFVMAYTEPVRYIAIVMGLAVLFGIGTYLMRLRADR